MAERKKPARNIRAQNKEAPSVALISSEPEERRLYTRYDTSMKIFFRVSYDINTKVKFQLMEGGDTDSHARKYSGISRNISVEGLCFSSHKKLDPGDKLHIEIYLPGQRIPVTMEGEARWSRPLGKNAGARKNIFTGVRLLSVNGRKVAGTIHYDSEHKLIWSSVLDSIFGSYNKFVKKIKKQEV